MYHQVQDDAESGDHGFPEHDGHDIDIPSDLMQ